MRYLFAKGNKTCRRCGGHILRRELYLLHSFKNPASGRYCSFPYHCECYLEYYCEKIRQKALYYMGQMEKPKKIGRPPIYFNGKKIDRVKALIRYHRKAGNETRAQEVEVELGELLLTNKL